MTAETFRYTQPDGFESHVLHWPADGETRAVVHIAHGLSEHAARYAETAEALVKHGLAVYAHDHRGHGRSIPEPADRGHWGPSDGFARVTDDLLRISQDAAERHDGAPVILLGHSAGSFMAQALMATHAQGYAGVALSASDGPVGPIGWFGRQVTRLERRRLGERGQSKLLNSLSFGAFNKAFEPARTPFDWLSRDPDQVDAYIEDPLCGFICTTQLWFDLLGALLNLHTRSKLAAIPKDLPIYVFAGDKDPVGKATKGLKKLLGLYKKAGLRRVTHRFYPDGRHEMLNETNREEVRADLIAWIDEVLAGSR